MRTRGKKATIAWNECIFNWVTNMTGIDCLVCINQYKIESDGLEFWMQKPRIFCN